MKPIAQPGPSSRYRPASRHPAGFTLTEMMVVIVIIIVLALVVIGSLNRITNNAHKAVCVQNLRGIGNAIVAYCMEKNNRLPGPLNVGQSALFNPAATSPGPQLVHYIAPYLEGLRDSDAPYLISNFGCPSLMKKMSSSNVHAPIVYRMGHDDLEDIYGRKGFPWIWNNPAGTTGKPWRLDQINPRSAGRVYAMIEQDQTLGGTWANNGASGPAHGNERMALYFDWSVKPRPVTQR
jgi:type II secretory pathway pseudopilin PulG